MAEKTADKGSGGRFLPSVRWDPFKFLRRRERRTRDVARWDPFSALAWPFERNADFFPDFEVKETRDALLFSADLPGVHDKDIEVSITGNHFSVSGKREAEREEKGEAWYTTERAYGTFARAFTLPEGVDVQHVSALLDHGVLTITVPKVSLGRPKKVSVKETQRA